MQLVHCRNVLDAFHVVSSIGVFTTLPIEDVETEVFCYTLLRVLVAS